MKKIRINSSGRIKILYLLVFSAGFIPKGQAQNCSVNAGLPQTICAGEPLSLKGNADGLLSGTITWSQVSGPSATIISPNNFETDVVGIVGGNVYKFRISANCTDGSYVFQDVEVVVNVSPDADAGSDQTYCPGSYILAGSSIPSGGSGNWSIEGNNGAGLNINDPSSPASGIALAGDRAGATTLRWTLTLGDCTSYDEVVITNRGGISPVDAGPDQNLSNCYSAITSTTMAGSFDGNNIDGQTGLWTIVSGPSIPNISNPSAHNTSISGLVEGTYVFRWTVTGPCASGSDLVTITVPPPAGSVTDASVSPNNPVYCDGRTSLVLTGNQPLYANEVVLWEQIPSPSGGVTIHNPNSSTTLVSGLDGSSSYSFRYSITNTVTNCSSSSVTTISYATPPSLTINSSTPLLPGCGEVSADIEYSQSGPGTVQYSIVSGPDGVFSYPTSYTDAGASPVNLSGFTANGTYRVSFRKGTTGAACSPVFATVDIIVSGIPVGSNAGTDQFVACNVNQTTLAGNIIQPGETGIGQWTQVSGPNAAVFSDPFDANSQVTGLINGLYVFRWLVTGGDECAPAQDDVEVRVASIQPNPATATGPDDDVCAGSPVVLEGRDPILNETGTWTLVSTDPVTANPVTFSPDIHSPAVVVDGLDPSTEYTFRWTIQNGCGIQFADVVVTTTSETGPIAADAGPDQCLPAGTASTILEGNIPDPGTGLWTLVSGPNTPTFVNENLYNTEISGLTSGTYEFEWTISYGTGCADTKDRVTITVWDITPAAAGSDQDICGTTAVFDANAVASGEVGEWSQVYGPAGYEISNVNDPNATITGLIDGAYLFRWTISNGACSSFDDVRIRVSTTVPSTADAGTVADVCGLTSVSLNANTPLEGTGLWSIVNAPNTPSFADPSSPTTTVSGLIPGNYTLRWTITGGTYCPPSSDVVTFAVYPVANAGSDASYCDAVAVNLNGTVNSTGTWNFVSYTGLVSGNYTLNQNAPNTATVTDLETGIYVFSYTIAAAGGCPESTDEVTITNLNTTDAAVITGPATTEYCDDPSGTISLTLEAVDPVVGTGSWSKVSGPAVSFDDAGSHITDVTLTGGPGIYLFRWTVTNGTCNSFDEITIANYAPPTIADAGDDQTAVCGFETLMEANLPDAGLGTWTQISGPNTANIESPILPNTIISGMVEGTYIFEWTITNGPVCTPSSDQVTVTTLQPPTPADAGPDQDLCNLTGTVLAANELTFGTGSWSQVSGPTTVSFDNVNDRNTTVNNLDPGTGSGTYVLRWTTTLNGCTSEDEVTITTWAEPTTATATNINECLYQPVNLTGNPPTVGTGQWTQTSGAPVIIENPSSPTSALLGLTAGDYNFKWTISNGPVCTASETEIDVTIIPLPTIAGAGADQFLCNSDNTTLEGNTPSEGTGTWTFVSGGTGATITDPTNPTTTVTDIPVGTHRLRWTISNGVCNDYFDEMFITRYPELEVTGPIASATYCEGGSQTLTVVASGGDGTGYTYQWFQSSTSGGPWTPVGGATNASYTIPTSLLTGNYYYYAEVTNCTIVPSSEAHIIVVDDPEVTTQPAGADYCSPATHSMTVVASGDAGTGALSYQWQTRPGTSGGWSDIGGAITTDYTTPSLTATAPNTLVRQYRVRIRQTASGCETFSDPATVNVYPVPAVTSASSKTICNGDNVNYTITSDVDGTAYEWSGAVTSGSVTGVTTTVQNTGSINDVLDNTGTTEAVVTYTITPTGPSPTDCAGNPFEFVVTVEPTPEVNVTNNASTICNGDDTNIILDNNGIKVSHMGKC
jgi:hypothetical protein